MTHVQIATATKKQIIMIIILSLIIVISLGGSTFYAIRINSEYMETKKEALSSGKDIYIVILEYEVDDFRFKVNSEPKEVKSFKFTDDLDVIYQFTNEYGFNTIQIKDGVAKVIDSDCRDKTCQNFYITNDISLFESHSIICYPHGLKVIWEVRD